MKASTDRILTTHVGSMPRPESIKSLLRARLAGETVDDAQLAARAAEAVAEAVRQQARVGLDVVSDGEMGKTSFLAYADDRLTGFVPIGAGDPGLPSSNAGGSWARRIDTRREWRAFRDYYEDYLPRAMPPSAPPTVCRGAIAYKGHAQLRRDLDAFKAALRSVDVQDAFVPAIAPGGAIMYSNFWSSYGASPLEALRGMIGRPWTVLSDAATSGTGAVSSSGITIGDGCCATTALSARGRGTTTTAGMGPVGATSATDAEIVVVAVGAVGAVACGSGFAATQSVKLS